MPYKNPSWNQLWKCKYSGRLQCVWHHNSNATAFKFDCRGWTGRHYLQAHAGDGWQFIPECSRWVYFSFFSSHAVAEACRKIKYPCSTIKGFWSISTRWYWVIICMYIVCLSDSMNMQQTLSLLSACSLYATLRPLSFPCYGNTSIEARTTSGPVEQKFLIQLRLSEK